MIDQKPVTSFKDEPGAASLNRLLDRELPQEYRDEWTYRTAQIREDDASDLKSVLIFRSGREFLALPSSSVREVVTPRIPHALPHQRGALRGLVSVRGELLIYISLVSFLSLKADSEIASLTAIASKTAGSGEQMIVALSDDGPLAFAVNEIYGFHQFNDDELKEIPSTLAEATATYTKSILHWNERMVNCLDGQLLFHAINRSLT